MRGVMNLRGRIIPVVDLRQRLGMTSATEETERFCATMDQRRQDHVKWLSELEASAREDREFTLATDPHRCAFGKWYDNYKAEDPWIRALLTRFDKPHQKIHSSAAEVLKLREQGRPQDALALIEKRRASVLSEMIGLFTSLQELIREAQREIAVVIQEAGRLFAVLVDAAVSIEKFGEKDIDPLPVRTHGAVVQVARRESVGNPILLLATGSLIDC
jgi:purine-binding chemotaxis protein CheW